MKRALPFVPAMCRAFWDRRKTMFRRNVVPHMVDGEMILDTARFQVGQLIWIQERYRLKDGLPDDAPVVRENIVFAADLHEAGYCDMARWCPATTLPREASRMTLLIEAVRTEHVQSITEEGARAEGVAQDWYSLRYPIYSIPGTEVVTGESARNAYARFWNELHGHTEAWGSNPLVYAVTVRPIRCNIEVLDRGCSPEPP